MQQSQLVVKPLSSKATIVKSRRIIERIIEEFEITSQDVEQKQSLSERVDELKREITALKEHKRYMRKVDDTLAEELIKGHLLGLKKTGTNDVSIVDLVEYLGLPVEQIEHIMKQLETAGVKEVD